MCGIVPIGALVAGDGLAALALERHTTTDSREHAWQEVEFTMFYRALYGRYLQQGIDERDARQKAYSEVRGYLGKGSMSASGVRQLSAPTGQPDTSEQNAQSGLVATRHDGSVKASVRAYLDANPGLDKLSVNQVLATLKTAGVQAGRTTLADVLQERKSTTEMP